MIDRQSERELAHLTRKRDEALAEWARVSSPNYREPIYRLHSLAVVVLLVVIAALGFAGIAMLGGTAFWLAFRAMLPVATVCVLIGWYA